MIRLRIKWLGTACFELQPFGGASIVIDPYVDDSVSVPFSSRKIESCEYIFITHGHYDHLLDVGKLHQRFAPEIYCSREVMGTLHEHQGIPLQKMHAVAWGDSLDLDGFKVRVLKGRHNDFRKEFKRVTGRDIPDKCVNSDPVGDLKESFRVLFGTTWLPKEFDQWKKRYPAGPQLNFVFDFGGGMVVYMAGTVADPDIIKEAEKAEAYITLLQVLNGDKLLGMEQPIADLALASGCKMAIPQHHDPLFKFAKPTDTTLLRRILSDAGVDFLELFPGKWREFSC